MKADLELTSPAKLNLFLHITGRQRDGYHQLQSVFQLLDWGDTIRFSRNDSGKMTLRCSGLEIPGDDNLILRAAQRLRQRNLGADISLEKRIPIGGGLGGGSSNAATTLLALNTLWECHLDGQELAQIGLELGADVPIFLGGRSAWAEGVGEILEPVDLPEHWYLILDPGCHISTAEIFSHRELTRNTSPIKIAAFFEGHSRNDCQELVRRLYPKVDKALNLLDKFGEARLTGTGACVFTRFDEEAQARAAQAQLPSGWASIVARGVNHSPLTKAFS